VFTFDELIRVSSMNGREESAESTKTIDDQRRGNRDAAKDAGGQIGKTFKLLDQSGRTIHETGVYETLVQRVRDGKSDGVVVTYGDRLTRNWRRVGVFYDELEVAGGQVIIAGLPGVDYRTATGRMVTGMMAVVSDMVGATAAERARRLMDEQIVLGVPAKCPYGYRRNATESGHKTLADKPAKSLVPDEHTAPVVRRIFDLRDAGQSWASIRRTLNDAGIPSPSGGAWTHGTLTSIIRRETYCGVLIIGKRRNEHSHEALVSRAQWRRVQQTKRIAASNPGKYVGGLGMGLVSCSGCGKPLSVRGLAPEHRKPGTRGSLTYGCTRTSRDGTCPRPVYVTKQIVDDYIEDELRDVLQDARLDLIGNSRDLQKRRDAWQAAREDRAAFVELVPATDPDFLRGKQARVEREARARAAYEDLAAEADAAEQIPDPAGYDALDLDGKRQLARLLIDDVVVSPPFSRSRYADVTERLAIDWKRAA
jgi:DNA invertase Pin-like site-specific DNA recombinase